MMQYATRKRLLIAAGILLVLITGYLLLKPSNDSYCSDPDEYGYCTEGEDAE